MYYKTDQYDSSSFGQKGRSLGHVTYFSNFGTPLISLERLKIQTSNFACRLILRDTKQKYETLVESGRGPGHVTYYFSNFGTPNISGTAEDTNLKFCTQC